jgi:benzylsuccinate CoA-transferase BbsF subunit
VRTPLAGQCVLDFCWVGAGALVTKMLAEHGATVIKVESRAHPDNLRLAPPYREGAEDLDGSGYFASRNPNKKSFALNMSHPEARDIARELVRHSTIVANNFRPGVMERWSLSYEEVRPLQPSLIYLSMPMQGSDGPHRRFVGFGSTISALAGLVHLSGRPERTPVGTGTHYPDHVPNPGHALVALLAAVYRREVTGEGEYIELAQLESTVNVIGPAIVAQSASGDAPTRQGNRVADASPHGVFPCADEDRWCAIAARTDAEWRAIAGVLGHPEWLQDARFTGLAGRKDHEDALEELIAEATRPWDRWELMAALQAAGVPAAVVETPGDLVDDPHLRERGFWRSLSHPVMGDIVSPGLPFWTSTGQAGPTRAAPLLGEHTWELAESLLGMGRDEYNRLAEAGVFH